MTGWKGWVHRMELWVVGMGKARECQTVREREGEEKEEVVGGDECIVGAYTCADPVVGKREEEGPYEKRLLESGEEEKPAATPCRNVACRDSDASVSLSR